MAITPEQALEQALRSAKEINQILNEAEKRELIAILDCLLDEMIAEVDKFISDQSAPE